MDTTNTCFTMSGVIFLGLGDTVAACYGSYYGTDKWRPELHNKTQQGSEKLTYTVLAIYYFCIRTIDINYTNYFMIFAFGTFANALVEGFTTQFDNLVCS